MWGIESWPKCLFCNESFRFHRKRLELIRVEFISYFTCEMQTKHFIKFSNLIRIIICVIGSLNMKLNKYIQSDSFQSPQVDISKTKKDKKKFQIKVLRIL